MVDLNSKINKEGEKMLNNKWFELYIIVCM